MEYGWGVIVVAIIGMPPLGFFMLLAKIWREYSPLLAIAYPLLGLIVLGIEKRVFEDRIKDYFPWTEMLTYKLTPGESIVITPLLYMIVWPITITVWIIWGIVIYLIKILRLTIYPVLLFFNNGFRWKKST